MPATTGRETDLASGGQVRAFGDQAAGHAQRDQEAHGGVADQVAHVGPGEEVVLQASDHDGGYHKQNSDRVSFENSKYFAARTLVFLFHIRVLLA